MRSDEGISLGFSPLSEKDVLGSQLGSQCEEDSCCTFASTPRTERQKMSITWCFSLPKSSFSPAWGRSEAGGEGQLFSLLSFYRGYIQVFQEHCALTQAD